MQIAVINNQANSHQLAISRGGKFYSCSSILTLTAAFRLSLAEFRTALETNEGSETAGVLIAPISPETEIWGAGVTYLRSRDARKKESGVPDVYQKVYEAQRPELFYKGNARRVRGPNAPIGVRYDSDASIPEPEVAIFINSSKEIIGYSACNDVTARTIEGENPLYLPQAKIYSGSCALGPMMLPAWLAPSPAEMTISARIQRNGKTIWDDSTSLASLHRSLTDLVDYLFRCQDFPDGVILSTGTGIVPPMDVALAERDVVEISVSGVGVLSNPVKMIPEIPKASFNP